MADPYGHFTDRVAVGECPSGSGAMYTLPPIARSNASSIPVIVLTIDVPLPCEGRSVLTELDCARLFEPVTKMSIQIKSASKLPEILRRAFRVATPGKPGAVHLQIPEGLLLEEADAETVSLHVRALTKSCGFLWAFQYEVSASISIPFLASSLSLIPLIHSIIAPRPFGIVTAHSGFWSTEHLGEDETRETLDPALLEWVVLDACRTLKAEMPAIGELLFECTNLFPYARSVLVQLGKLVFGINHVVALLHAWVPEPDRFSTSIQQ